MLSNLGLVIYAGFLRSNRILYKDLEAQKMALAKSFSTRRLTSSLIVELRDRFDRVFSNYFASGVIASRALVDKEVARIARVLKVPFLNSSQPIDLVNNYSIFRGFSDTLYAEGFKTGEINRMRKFLLSSAYDATDERAVADQLQKSFNLTRKRAQLLARDETTRLRETTKVIYYNQPEVQEKYELVWSAISDSVSRHESMDGLIASPDGTFQSPVFGSVKAPPLAYNCRCSTYFRERNTNNT